LAPIARRLFRGHDHGNHLTIDAGLSNIGHKGEPGILQIPFLELDGVRVNSINLFPIGLSDAEGQSYGGFSLPAADFDDHPIALIDLPEMIEAVHFIVSQHAGQGVNLFKLFHRKLIRREFSCVYTLWLQN
jgi:hypothetical protein